MSSVYLQVYPFFQKKIAESGLVIDEDLEHMNNSWSVEEQTTNKISKQLIILGTVIFGLFCTFQREKPETMLAAGAVLALPVVSTCAVSFYNTRKKNILKKNLEDLLDAFKSLSRSHTEVYDFLKCFEKSIGTAKQPFNISEGSVLGLAKTAFDFQVSITKMMRIIICEINIELKNLLLDMDEFDRATSIELSYLTIKDSIYNASFVEGQVILLRSHLLISIYLLCSTSTNPQVLLKLMENSVPQLVTEITGGVSIMKKNLEYIRFPKVAPYLNLSSLDNIVSKRSVAILPRMRRNLTKINDNACCTILKLQTLLVTLDNIQSEQQMVMLEREVSNVAQELFQCYVSAADFAKLLEILNGNQTRRLENEEINHQNITEESISITNSEEETSDELAGESLDYQEFASNIVDGVDEDETMTAERRAISFYRKALKQEEQSGLMIELQQSDEFKKRQIKFKTVLTSTPAEASFPVMSVSSSSSLRGQDSPSTAERSELLLKVSTPAVDLSTETSAECISSVNSATTLHSSTDTTCSSYQTISKEDLLQDDKQNPMVSHIPPPPPLPQLLVSSRGESNLQASLKGALAKMGKPQEDTYE